MVNKSTKKTKYEGMRRGDATLIASIKQCSRPLVSLVIQGKREDKRGILDALNKLISFRNSLSIEKNK